VRYFLLTFVIKMAGVFGVGMRTVAAGLGCLGVALLAGCGSDAGSPVVPATTQTVTFTPSSTGSRPSEPAGSATSTGPRAKIFDQAAVQDSVKRILTTDYKVEGVTTVTCPAKQEVKEGGTFDCAVALADVVKKVTITVTSDEGDYEVGALQ
jgi:hypothetical protein